jgi:hypothetical protein
MEKKKLVRHLKASNSDINYSLYHGLYHSFLYSLLPLKYDFLLTVSRKNLTWNMLWLKAFFVGLASIGFIKESKYNIKKLKLWTTKIIINFQNYRIIQTQKLEENQTNKNWRAKVNVRKMLGFVLLKFKLLIPTRRKISLHANNSVWKRGFRGKIPWNKTLL